MRWWSRDERVPFAFFKSFSTPKIVVELVNFAYELTKRCPSDSVEKLAGTLVDAQDDIDRRREQLIAEIEGKLQQRVSREALFSIRWRLT